MEFYFILISAIGTLLGGAFFASRIKLHITGIQTIGVITKKQKRKWSTSEGGGHANLLVIKYYDASGSEKIFTEQNSIAEFFYKVGGEVPLICDPKKPSRVMIRSFIVLYSAPLVLITLSLGAAYAGFCL
jgi:hypothetical protein